MNFSNVYFKKLFNIDNIDSLIILISVLLISSVVDVLQLAEASQHN